MKSLIKNPLALTLFIAALSFSLTSWAQPGADLDSCPALLTNQALEIEKVQIDTNQFLLSTRALRNTLSGKLATVWRSEWKSKNTVAESNRYILDLVNQFLTPLTQKSVLAGLDVQQEGFARQIHQRLYALQTNGHLDPMDNLMVRDPAPPKGIQDITFTYYTKPIVDGEMGGKHQFRIRGYVRKIDFEALEYDVKIAGFDEAGAELTITRIDAAQFKVETTSIENVLSSKILSLAELQKRFGSTGHSFAPHSKSLKLEVKTSLEDQIISTDYPLLAGPHMVQKLDATLSYFQVAELFAPFSPELNTAAKRMIAIERIQKMKAELIRKKPDQAARITAVFDVLEIGVRGNEKFLELEGATFYHRTAFESRSGFQTTIDREQGVYARGIYANSHLLSPMQMVQSSDYLATGIEDARHIELKLPVHEVANLLGIQYQDSTSKELVTDVPVDRLSQQVLKIFSSYVESSDHPGKFNYLIQNGHSK